MKNSQGSKERNSVTGNFVLIFVLAVIVIIAAIFKDDILYHRAYTPGKETAFTVVQIVMFPGSTIYRYDVERETDGREFRALASSDSVFGLGDVVGLVKFRYKGKACYSITSVAVTNM